MNPEETSWDFAGRKRLGDREKPHIVITLSRQASRLDNVKTERTIMVKKRSVYLLLWWVSALGSHSQANEDPTRRIVPAQSTRQAVTGDVMKQIYLEIKTPYK